MSSRNLFLPVHPLTFWASSWIYFIINPSFHPAPVIYFEQEDLSAWYRLLTRMTQNKLPAMPREHSIHHSFINFLDHSFHPSSPLSLSPLASSKSSFCTLASNSSNSCNFRNLSFSNLSLSCLARSSVMRKHPPALVLWSESGVWLEAEDAICGGMLVSPLSGGLPTCGSMRVERGWLNVSLRRSSAIAWGWFDCLKVCCGTPIAQTWFLLRRYRGLSICSMIICPRRKFFWLHSWYCGWTQFVDVCCCCEFFPFYLFLDSGV